MPLAQLLNTPVTITRRTASGAIDEYGDETSTESTVETVGELQQTARDERDLSGETSETTWLLFLPAGTEIGTADAVTVDGQTYELVGAPWPARNPRTKTVSHVQATVKRIAGSDDT